MEVYRDAPLAVPTVCPFSADGAHAFFVDRTLASAGTTVDKEVLLGAAGWLQPAPLRTHKTGSKDKTRLPTRGAAAWYLWILACQQANRLGLRRRAPHPPPISTNQTSECRTNQRP